MRGLQIWRSEGIQSHAEDLLTPAVGCLYFEGLSEWHIGAVASCHASMKDVISLAKEVNDMNALAVA